MPLKRALAEFVGTFVLVLGGVGAAVIAGDKVGNVGIAFAFGLSLLAMAYAVGPVSGCHINPAVTFGLFLRGKVSADELFRYWAAQVLGAIVASLILLLIVKARAGGYDAGTDGLGANGFGSHASGGYPWGAALVVEILMTAFLVFTVLSATDRMAEVAFAGIPIGLVLVLIHLVSIPVDNTSVNPARSIGPAIFVGGFAIKELWVFIVGPLLGGALGALVHGVLFTGAEPVPAEESAVAADAPLR